MRANVPAALGHEIALERTPDDTAEICSAVTTDAIADRRSLALKLAVDRMHDLFRARTATTWVHMAPQEVY
jgi:hypothetical protein